MKLFPKEEKGMELSAQMRVYYNTSIRATYAVRLGPSHDGWNTE
jgi:hypothetical protein